MNNPNLPKETEPEIIVERYDEPEEPKKSGGFFSDLNTDGASNKKLFAIVSGVLGVSMITIFMIDAFMTPQDSDKHLDLSKKEAKATPTPKEEVAGTDTVEPEKTTKKVTNTVPKKPTATQTPPTIAPTKTPDPTATPQPTTAPPTNTPVPPTATPAVVPTEITPNP